MEYIALLKYVLESPYHKPGYWDTLYDEKGRFISTMAGPKGKLP